MRTTIIYYTDNSIPDDMAKMVRDKLIVAAEGKPIISVSQKPINFGKNICVGEIGRSHLSLYKQMLIGGEAAETEFVALAEHDCLYSPEHFNWIPPRGDIFWYNINHWYVQWKTGEYSYQRRRPLSQLICARDIFLKAVREKVWMLEHGYMIRKGQAGAMEPGCQPDEKSFIKITAEPGVCDNRADYQAALAQFKDLGKEIGRWIAKGFATVFPNLDIRHDGNFSGGRVGKNRTFTLPYWGNFKEAVCG